MPAVQGDDIEIKQPDEGVQVKREKKRSKRYKVSPVQKRAVGAPCLNLYRFRGRNLTHSPFLG